MKDYRFIVSAQMHLQDMTDAYASNIANSSTNGFRKIITRATNALDKEIEIIRSNKQGGIRRTGSPLDIAIEGQGFLKVELSKNKFGFTRDGNLNVKNGVLVTTDRNLPVLDSGDRPITLSGGGKIYISETGEVSQDTSLFGKVSLGKISTHKLGRLSYLGGGVYDSKTQEPDTKSLLIQGHLEKSNVDSIKTMNQLIKANNLFSILHQTALENSKLKKLVIDTYGKV